MVPFGFKNSWHVWFHIFCGIEILELNGIDVDVETYIVFFYFFWSTIYSTKRGWSAGHYAEAIWRLQSVVKTSVKDKRAAEKNRWSQRAEENHGKSGLYKINKWIKLIFILQTLVSLQNAFFSETIFKGFVNPFLMPLYSRWISMIWIL